MGKSFEPPQAEPMQAEAPAESSGSAMDGLGGLLSGQSLLGNDAIQGLLGLCGGGGEDRAVGAAGDGPTSSEAIDADPAAAGSADPEVAQQIVAGQAGEDALAANPGALGASLFGAIPGFVKDLLPFVIPGLGPVMQIQEALEERARRQEQERRQALTPADAEERARQDPGYAQRLLLAQDLIRTGGTGDLGDGRLVVEQLVNMPVEALQALRDNETRVVVCRNSVTDYREDLRGQTPRGWRPGSTWDTVPGANTRDRNEVVIAVVGHGTEAGAHVPRAGEGHGSHNLVIHEAMHAVDHSGEHLANGAHSDSADFVAARNADSAAIGRHPYLAQEGAAGREESYSEIAARYYSGDPTLEREMPNLYRYFQSNPLARRQTGGQTGSGH